jgi:inosose dehydratase
MAFETFGSNIEEWGQESNNLATLLRRHDLPLCAAYHGATWIDPAKVDDDIATVMRYASLAKGLGTSTLVLQADRIPRGTRYTPDQFKAMISAFNEVGRRCHQMGMRAAIHPHTGTAIESWEDIETTLDSIDPKTVFFAPDTGQIAKGGSDIVTVFETYKDLIKHVHLKDWCGKVDYRPDGTEVDYSGYVNYEPVGNGVLPIPKLLEILESVDYDGWLAVELDATPRAPRPPREAAAMSRQYLGGLLGNNVAWRRSG